MRHRFLVALYSDLAEEAEIADHLASLPQSRRQEFLRTIVKLGYNHLYNTKSSIAAHSLPPKPDKAKPKTDKPVKEHKKIIEETKKSTENDNIDNKTDELEKSRRDTSHNSDNELKSSHNKGSIAEKNNEPKDDSRTDEDDDDDLDPMKKINNLFDGI